MSGNGLIIEMWLSARKTKETREKEQVPWPNNRTSFWPKLPFHTLPFLYNLKHVF